MLTTELRPCSHDFYLTICVIRVRVNASLAQMYLSQNTQGEKGHELYASDGSEHRVSAVADTTFHLFVAVS